MLSPPGRSPEMGSFLWEVIASIEERSARIHFNLLYLCDSDSTFLGTANHATHSTLLLFHPMKAQSVKVLHAEAPSSFMEQLSEASIAVMEYLPEVSGNAIFYTDPDMLNNARVQGLTHPLLDEMQALFDANPGHTELWLA